MGTAEAAQVQTLAEALQQPQWDHSRIHQEKLQTSDENGQLNRDVEKENHAERTKLTGTPTTGITGEQNHRVNTKQSKEMTTQQEIETA